MITRMSSFFLRTFREDPADAELASQRLLIRSGYIRPQAAGVFAWLPLGLRVRTRLEAIIREEMTAAGAHEVLLPALLPREPFETTGRWTGSGEALFRLQDRRGDDHLLAPAHEEAFTLMARDIIRSHRDLPVTIFQIRDSFRDETRPRAGLLCGREFTKVDACSFDLDDESLAQSCRKQRDALGRIFSRLGLEYVIVRAGSANEEFLVPTEVGEDVFVRSAGGYAARLEAFETVAPEPLPAKGQPEPVVFDTPQAGTIDALVAHANNALPRTDGRTWQAADTLKNVVLALTEPGGKRELVIVGIPGDREVDLARAETAFAGAAVETASEDDLSKHPTLIRGYIGPIRAGEKVLGLDGSSGIRYLLDPRIVAGSSWVTGANESGKHVAYLIRDRDFSADGTVDIADVRDGDPAPDGSGPVRLMRGVKLGHVLQLGRRYSEALGLEVLDASGRLVPVTMGSYGISVTRLLAVLAELNHDERGLKWPAAVAPFDVHIVVVGKDQAVLDIAGSLAASLDEQGMAVLLDDRVRVSPGVKFGDAELIGVPRIVVVGRDATDGFVEVRNRAAGSREKAALADLGAVI